jgi:hypothetical protein
MFAMTTPFCCGGLTPHAVNTGRDLMTCLQRTQHETVLLRVLLTVKNSLRCVKKGDSPLAQRWLQSDRNAMREITRIASLEQTDASAPSSREQTPSRSQAIKAAVEIRTYIQNTR